jgi:hypothetical protein
MRTASPFLSLASLSLMFGSAHANSGYYASCNSGNVAQPGTTPHYGSSVVKFSANCAQNNGVYNVDTSLDLSKCFANANGQLVIREK